MRPAAAVAPAQAPAATVVERRSFTIGEGVCPPTLARDNFTGHAGWAVRVRRKRSAQRQRSTRTRRRCLIHAGCDHVPVRRPLIIAHRGASHSSVDNSREAYERAIADGADLIEFDVRRTRDEQLIAFHDPAVAGQPIGVLTIDEVARHLGRQPMTLDEILDLAEGRIGLDVEIKEAGYVQRVLDAVGNRFGAEAVLVTSFLDEVVRATRDLWPEVETALVEELASARGNDPDSLTTRARQCGAAGVAVEQSLVQRDGLDWAAEAGLAVYVWTINDAPLIQALLAHSRVRGVITDVPGRAVELRERLEGAS